MSDGSCRVVGLLSILRYQQNIRAWSASALPLNGYRARKLVGLGPLRAGSRLLEDELGEPSPAKPDAGRLPVTNLAVHIRVRISRRFSELAVFDARLYIRVRCIDEPAERCGV
jgi:hypothetical protein